MANLLKIKRGTRAQLNAAVTGNTLNLGEPYLITDENRIAVGTGSNSYEVFAKSSEIQALDADLTAISGLAGTGFLKRTGTDSWALDTTSYQTLDADLTAIAALSGTSGILKKTAADTWVLDTSAYLTGNQSISVTGDATGTGTTAITLTLANSGVTAGTYAKVTVDAKGRVTSGTTLIATDIPTLTAAKISDFNTAVRTNRLDQMTAPDAAVAMNANKITGLADPTNPQDAATKNYVDLAIQGLDPKASTVVATTANLTATAATSTLTNSGTQAALAIDGVTLAANDRVLVKDQTTPAQNGIYVVTNIGSVSTNWVLTRADDASLWAELPAAFVFVEKGTINADNGYLFTVEQGGTLGTTPITITQFSGAGQITAGNGLTKSGNTIDVVGTANRITVAADAVDIASTYVGQTSITTLGTIATGVWNGTAIAATFGGTGQTTYATGDILYANGANTLTKLTKPASLDSFLQMTSAGVASWVSTIDGGTF